MSTTIDQYAVLGNPIQHSLSPQIHRALAQQTRQAMDYKALLVPLDGFKQAVSRFFTAPESQGLNITLPFKQQAYQLVDELSERAQQARAVNTICRQADNKLYGDNTDGVGLVSDIVNKGGCLTDAKVLLVGAGGAVRGVLGPIIAARPALVVITNRTLAKAQALAADWQEQGKVLACSFNQLDQYYFDWIINGTAASLAGQQLPLPDGILAPQSWSYDMVYGPETSPFSHWAKQQGAQYNLDGLGMLVEQAAEAFFLWRAIRPDSQQVLKTLAQAIKPHS